MPKLTTEIIIEAKAFNSGVTPNLTLEKTKIGRVVAPGPAMKLAITTSSREIAKASSQPAIIDGKIMGRVILKKTVEGLAPRSMAASSREISNSLSLA